MDSLEDLPYDDEEEYEEVSPKKKALIQKFTGGVGATSARKSQKSKDGESSSDKWKLVGYITVIFLVLANPWISGMLSNLPYVGGSSITEFLTVSVIFVIAITISIMYL